MRAICTSAPLQASIRVSPDFTLFRHSSPPFGSKQAHSNSPSEEGGRCWANKLKTCAHHCKTHPVKFERSTGNNIFPLACLFDSLVRVSRRVKVPHFQTANFVSLPRRERFTAEAELAPNNGSYPQSQVPTLDAARVDTRKCQANR